MPRMDESTEIQKFIGNRTDHYSLWRLRAEIALKGKGYWKQLKDDPCETDVKDKASTLLVVALGDTALRACAVKIGNPLEMLEMLNNGFALNRTATRISVLTSMYIKRFNCKRDDIATFVDEFESLFAQLERMGAETEIPESHKAPLLLVSMGNNSPLESTVAALRKKETDKLSWEDVTSDLIQEWNQIKSRYQTDNNNNCTRYDKK